MKLKKEIQYRIESSALIPLALSDSVFVYDLNRFRRNPQSSQCQIIVSASTQIALPTTYSFLYEIVQASIKR